MKKIKGKIGACCCFTVNFIGRKFGLALLWFDGTKLEIVNYFYYRIHYKFREESKGSDYFLTGFYGIPKTRRRLDFWHLLGKINHDFNADWCVQGDFNEITTHDEKFGGRPRPVNHMEAFKLALERNGLIDLGWKEQKYT